MLHLSAPMYLLKRRAKLLSRKENIPLHQALDRVAASEGFRNWSLLSAKAQTTKSVARIYEGLSPGDLVLIGARPGQGKTMLSLELALQAIRAGNSSHFFTLDYSEQDCQERLNEIDGKWKRVSDLLEFDGCGEISADYVIGRLENAPRGTFVVTDYLQILDQKRKNPELMIQVEALGAFARERGLVIVFISQIDQTYDPQRKRVPDLGDVRLPNPLDLRLFQKSCFLHAGEMRFGAVA